MKWLEKIRRVWKGPEPVASWPHKLADGSWRDSAGKSYDKARDAWSRKLRRPSVTAKGVFRAKRGAAKQASGPKTAPEQGSEPIASKQGARDHTITPANDKAREAWQA